MTRPEDSTEGFYVFMFINTCVIVTLILIVIETFPPYREEDDSVMYALEVIFSVIFSIEYTSKLIVVPWVRWIFLYDVSKVSDLPEDMDENGGFCKILFFTTQRDQIIGNIQNKKCFKSQGN